AAPIGCRSRTTKRSPPTCRPRLSPPTRPPRKEPGPRRRTKSPQPSFAPLRWHVGHSHQDTHSERSRALGEPRRQTAQLERRVPTSSECRDLQSHPSQEGRVARLRVGKEGDGGALPQYEPGGARAARGAAHDGNEGPAQAGERPPEKGAG